MISGCFCETWCETEQPNSLPLPLRGFCSVWAPATKDSSRARSSTQVWALCSETRALREADISWFRHVASEKRACSLGMRCVTLAARDSCAISVPLAHRPVPPQRRGLWWTKWKKNGFTKGTRRTMVLGYECPDLCRRPWYQHKVTIWCDPSFASSENDR